MIGIILAILLSLGALSFTKKIPGRLILLTLIWGSWFLFFRGGASEAKFNENFTIKSGDSIKAIAKNLGSIEKAFVSEAKKIGANPKPGTYNLSGTYSAQKLLEIFEKGPEQKVTKVTILEGWSIYDTDQYLTKEGLISSGDYIKYVTNEDNISTLKEKYKAINGLNLTTLEGYLYPETYNLDNNGSPVKSLVQLQLAQFDKLLVGEEKIAGVDGKFSQLLEKIKQTHGLEMSRYDIIKLASIIQKEERNKENIPTIAGIFLNRLKTNDTLGADITLCYAFKEPYSTCDSRIQEFLKQENDYNTRVKKGLTPTPISNIDIETFKALNNYEDTDYLFYLHGSDGKIYYAKTNSEHNVNKAKYLK